MAISCCWTTWGGIDAADARPIPSISDAQSADESGHRAGRMARTSRRGCSRGGAERTRRRPRRDARLDADLKAPSLGSWMERSGAPGASGLAPRRPRSSSAPPREPRAGSRCCLAQPPASAASSRHDRLAPSVADSHSRSGRTPRMRARRLPAPLRRRHRERPHRRRHRQPVVVRRRRHPRRPHRRRRAARRAARRSRAKQRIDARGHIVAPGFIDIQAHSWDDAPVARRPRRRAR